MDRHLAPATERWRCDNVQHPDGRSGTYTDDAPLEGMLRTDPCIRRGSLLFQNITGKSLVVEGLIGCGKYSEVFLCEVMFAGEGGNKKGHKPIFVVLKCILPEVANAMQLLANEMQIQPLTHPHLCKIIDNPAPGMVVMEYLQITLDDLLKRCNDIDRGNVVVHMLSGVQALGERGIVHRDLRMDNVMLDASTGMLKLIDFGLSKWIRDGGLCYTMELYSTCYRPPELLLQQDPLWKGYDTTADLFAVGVIALELFASENMHQHMYAFPARDERELSVMHQGFFRTRTQISPSLLREFENDTNSVAMSYCREVALSHVTKYPLSESTMSQRRLEMVSVCSALIHPHPLLRQSVESVIDEMCVRCNLARFQPVVLPRDPSKRRPLHICVEFNMVNTTFQSMAAKVQSIIDPRLTNVRGRRDMFF